MLALLLELLRPFPGAVSDRAASDRVVDRLEQRLARRVEDLAAERERLTAREAGLAARERDIEQKLAELRTELGAPPPEPSDKLSQGVLAAAEERLQERIAEVTRREQALAKRAAPLAVREQEVRERSQRLEARTRELDERSKSLDELAAELDARDRAAPAPPPPPEPAPEPEPESEAAEAPAETPEEPVPAAAGTFARWNLHELENLVRSRGDEYPDRVPEWESYLFFLRDYASSDGSVPETFDWLIQDAFSELVA